MAPTAAAFGQLVAAYSRAVATSALVEIIPETPLPQSPTLWISWHENNLITLALHRRVTGRAAVALRPAGRARYRYEHVAFRPWRDARATCR